MKYKKMRRSRLKDGVAVINPRSKIRLKLI